MAENIAKLIKTQMAQRGNRETLSYKNEDTGKYIGIGADSFLLQTNKVSKALLSLGYGLEDKIGIFSDNTPQWLFCDMGILAVRAISVPFFANASKQQLQYMIDETEMSLLFVGNTEQLEKAEWLLEHCPSLKNIVTLDEIAKPNNPKIWNWASFLELGNDIAFSSTLETTTEQGQASDIATIIYTSGTTGEPKGVILDHHNFYHCFLNHDIRLKIDETDVSLCFLPLSHIFERAWSLYLLYRGIKNVVLKNPRQVIETMKESKPSIMCTVPRFYEKTHEGIQAEFAKWPAYKQKIFNWGIAKGMHKMEYNSQGKKAPFAVNFRYAIANALVLKKFRAVFGGNIKLMPSAGAAMRPDLIKFFHAAGIFVDYGYGTTETTATVSCFKPDVFSYESCGSIMPNTFIKIGENDEIMVKGETVFKGYYKKPEETAKVLQDGWYKTGDSGYTFGDDYLMMTDRIRDIFKTSGGKYVSPQKIELLLGQEPLIEQVMAIGDNRKYITALIVPSKVNLTALAEKLGLPTSEYESLLSQSLILDYFKQRIDKSLVELSPFEKVVKFSLLPEPFTVENKALTSTLKIRRKIVMEQYGEIIDKMYP